MNPVTADDLVYLRADTKIEPLAGRWYAWGHLVSPLQQALNIAFRHLPMMKSFIANAAIHEAASRNPKMLGGSFLELKQSDVAAVKKLMQDTTARCTHLIQAAEDLIKLDGQLQKSQTGFSLDGIYEQLPATLAGFVEATYDLKNHPSLRIIEELLVECGLDNTSTQEISLSLIKDEQRNFFLNTPRLDNPARMILPMPFSDPRFDLISSSRIAATPFAALCDSLKVDAAQDNQFREYFTDSAPARNQPGFQGNGVRVRYFGHACVLIQTRDVSILIDPFLTFDRNDAEGRLTFSDLPDFIDYIFLTHNHQDHFCPEVLLQLRKRVGHFLVPRNNPYCFADPSMKLTLNSLGFHNVIVMDPMDVIPLADGKLTSLPFYGEHADLAISSKHGMHLQLGNRSFLFLADSDCKDRMLYRRLATRLGRVDTLFLGMECNGAPLSWLYGPYLTNPIGRKDDDSRRLSGCDAAHAWHIVEEFGCRQAFVYAMGQEPWLKFVSGLQYTSESKQIVESDKLVTRCREAGIPAERLFGCRSLEF